MALSAGSRLGPYEVIAPLGAGGMGEVYRARDARLGREVAIKVLPETFAADPVRLQRFEQEARAASALNHPNIVTVHDIGQANGAPYIAMELIEGSSVRELIAGGPLPVRRLLAIATQAAEGLAKAHGAGIVHRDLKPENIMVSTDGFVKILDFGLAKLVAENSEAASRVPTVAKPETHPGTVMGTVGYMSPEQAAGQAVDFRSDQFSFGSILYEMATGKRAFQRPTTVDTLSAILHDEPEPIASLAPKSPAPLRWIVDRCLAKDPKERYASTIDLAKDLTSVRQHISELSGGEAVLPSRRGRRNRERVAWSAVVVALLVGLAAGILARGRGRPDAGLRQAMRLNLTFPAAQAPVPFPDPVGPSLALSPDGTRLVYLGVAPEGTLLYQRPLDQFTATPIPGTAGAMGPFFSPDGRWIGFWADKKLKKVSLAGGQPLNLCEAAVLRGADWGPDGTILFSPYGNTGLFRVSESGGAAKPVTTPDKSKGETTHRWPEILPGGKAAIFTAHGASGNYDDARIGVVLLQTGERRTLLEGGTDARYLPTGHLVYLRGSTLYAVPFDVQRLAVTGSPVPVLNAVETMRIIGIGSYAFSSTGTLVYFPSNPQRLEQEFVWLDRKGNVRPLTETRRVTPAGGLAAWVRISPDGRRLATVAGQHPEQDIWIYDLTRNAWDRLISGGGNGAPVWSPDGRNIAFGSNRGGSVNPYWMPVDRSRPAEQLVKTDAWIYPLSFSPDGRTLLLQTDTPETSSDISVLELDGDRKPRPFIQTPSSESDARFSPDGRFVAYDSDESGRLEVFVTAYLGPRGRWQVSTEGGKSPAWSRDGRELFYLAPSGKVMAVAVETRPEFHAGVPQALFDLGKGSSFDVAPDGQNFAAIRQSAPEGPPVFSVVLNWFDDVRRRVAAEKKAP